MFFRPHHLHPLFSRERNAVITRKVVQEETIDMTAGEQFTIELDRQHPIQGLLMELTGNYVVGGSAATGKGFAGYAGMELLKNLSIIIDSEDRVYDLPGWAYPLIHRHAKPEPMRVTEDLTSVSTNAFKYQWWVPFDVGGYISLLDASRNNQLTLDATFGQDTDVATGGGTFSTSNVKLKTKTVQIAGGERGKLGGLDAPYTRSKWSALRFSGFGTQNDYEIELAKNRAYTGMFLVSRTSAAAGVAGTISRAKIDVNTTRIADLTSEDLKAQAAHEYGSFYDIDGVWPLPAGDPQALEHQLGISGNQELTLKLDVDSTSSPTLFVVQNWLSFPQAG